MFKNKTKNDKKRQLKSIEDYEISICPCCFKSKYGRVNDNRVRMCCQKVQKK
jgi:hypothetical protein